MAQDHSSAKKPVSLTSSSPSPASPLTSSPSAKVIETTADSSQTPVSPVPVRAKPNIADLARAPGPPPRMHSPADVETTNIGAPSTHPINSISPPVIDAGTYNLTAASLLKDLASADSPSIWLGGDDVLENVEWQRDGGRDVLVLTDTGKYPSDTPEDVAPTRNEATLCIVGAIANDKFNLTATGEWWPNSKFNSNTAVESTKATGFLEAPALGDLGSLFSKCIPNLEALQAAAPQVRTTRKGLFENQGSGTPRVRISHPLYMELPRSRCILNREFEEMRNWPVSTKQRPLFDELCERRSHIVQPLPAYDVDRKLIDPWRYEKDLRGAIVEVHFTLEHFRFTRDSTFVATVQEIIVHRMPVRILATPSRKRSYSVKPADSPSFASATPTKKARVTNK